MKTAFNFTITRNQAVNFAKELEAMHAALPQPASGSTRELRVYSADPGDDELLVADLVYLDSKNQLIMGYYLMLDKNGAVVTYEGDEKDFGYGDVGPYRGIHQKVTPDQRKTLDAVA